MPFSFSKTLRAPGLKSMNWVLGHQPKASERTLDPTFIVKKLHWWKESSNNNEVPHGGGGLYLKPYDKDQCFSTLCLFGFLFVFFFLNIFVGV